MRFDLSEANPRFRPLVERRIGELSDLYPWVPLRLVRTYRPRRGDRSMGNTSGGVISLNLYWFGRDPRVLARAALDMPVVDVGGGRRVPWHGVGWCDEPRHVLTHEFGHAAAPAVGGWRRWADDGWLRATADPDLAPSGYAIARTSGDPAAEFWAESFARYAMGCAPRDAAAEMRGLLER